MSAVLFEKRDHVAWLTINRPESKNTLNADVFVLLSEAWQEIKEDKHIRVAVLTAAGDVDFCCGGDLSSVIPIWMGTKEAETEIEKKLKADPHIVDEGLGQRVTPANLGDLERSVASPITIVAFTMICLQSTEVGEYIGITPAGIAAFCPTVEIAALATVEDVSIDRTRATEHLAPRLRYAPARGPVAGLGLVQPVDAGVEHGFDEPGRNVDVRVTIRWSRFEDTNSQVTLLRQAIGKYATGAAGADDDIVEPLGHAG